MTQINKNLTSEKIDSIKESDGKDRQARQSSRVKRIERKRIPLFSQKRLPSVDVPDGYIGRWINDIDERIYAALKSGYTFLDKKTGNLVMVDKRVQDSNYENSSVICKNTGGITTYFMVIEKDIWKSDQELKECTNRLVDEELENPTMQTGNGYKSFHEVDVSGHLKNSRAKADDSEMRAIINKAVQEGIKEALVNEN